MAGNRGGRRGRRVFGVRLLGAGPGASRGYGRRGRPPQVVNEISRGEKATTPDIALPRAMAMYGEL